jgi:hypothetical protein
MYLKTDGSAYFGGALSSGVIRNALQTTDTSATAAVTMGPFSTNGAAKDVVVAYEYAYTQQRNQGTATLSGSGGATIILERSLDSGVNWVFLQQFTVYGQGSVETDDEPGVPDRVNWSMSGSLTTTDNSAATTQMMLRARVSARTLMSVGGSGPWPPTIRQTTSVSSVED